MQVFTFELLGTCMRDLDTEIKFNIASARFDEADLIKMSLTRPEEDSEVKRLTSCVTRILGSLKKEGSIQFYVSPASFLKMTTETQYVINKFPEHITTDETTIVFYVKL